MRVLHVVEATTAGVRRHVFTLASAIDRSRYHVAVACPPVREQAFGDSAFVQDLEQAGVPTFPVAMTRSIRPAADAHALGALVQLLRAEQFDLLHAHSSKAGILGRVAARVVGIPAVYTPHSLYFLGLSNSLKRRAFLTIEQLGGLVCDRIIAVSPGERDLIVKSGIARAKKVACIENGIVLPVLPQNYNCDGMRRLLGATETGPLIGTVARVTAQKNPRLFLQAAAALLRNLPDARFVWCGGGDLQPQAEQWAQELGVAHAIRFLGHREDVAPVLAALDVFWLTSAHEGLPTSLLEAMALRVPVVATDVVGTRDVLRGEAGLLVPQHAESLVQATLMLMQRRELRAAFAQTASAWVAERWNHTRMARETEAVYDAVVAEHSVAYERRPTTDHRRLTANMLGGRQSSVVGGQIAGRKQ